MHLEVLKRRFVYYGFGEDVTAEGLFADDTEEHHKRRHIIRRVDIYRLKQWI